MIQALGDYDAASTLSSATARSTRPWRPRSTSLTDLPVDIDPSYPLEGLQ